MPPEIHENFHHWISEALYEHIPLAICVVDRDFQIVEANKIFAQWYGEWRGRPCYQVYKDRGTPCPDCPAQGTFDDGRPRVLEESGLDRNSQTIHYLARVVPLRDETGHISHVAAITTDLTATKRLQKEYQTLFEKVPCYVAVINRDLRVVRANERFRETFGEPMGEHCYHLFKRKHEPCPECPVERTFLERIIASWIGEDDEEFWEAHAWDALAPPAALRAIADAARFPVGEPLALMPFRIEVR